MDIDVNTLRRQLHEQHERRMAAVKNHILERFSHGMRDHAVAYSPAIDKEKLAVGPGAVIAWFGHPAVHTNLSSLLVNSYRVLQEFPAHNPIDPSVLFRLGYCRGQDAGALAVVLEFKADVKSRQCEAPHKEVDMVEFGSVAAQELAPGRYIVKQVLHIHPRTGMDCGGFWVRDFSPANFNAPAMGRFGMLRGQVQARDRSHTRQGLSPETHGHHPLQVFK